MRTSVGTLMLAVAALASACATTHRDPPKAPPKPTSYTDQKPIYTTDRDWQACADRAISAAEERARREGRPVGLEFGVGGAGIRLIKVEKCGPRPSPKDLTQEMRQALEAGCDAGGFEDLANVYSSRFSVYADDSQIIKKARTECATIGAKAAAKARAERRQAAKERMQHNPTSGFSVLRVYPSSSISTAILVETTEARRVKCGIYDADGALLDVEMALVSPPVDKVIVIHDTPPAVATARCWF